MLTVALILLGIYLLGGILSVSATAAVDPYDVPFPAFLFSWVWLGFILFTDMFEGFIIPPPETYISMFRSLFAVVCIVGGLIVIVSLLIAIILLVANR